MKSSAVLLMILWIISLLPVAAFTSKDIEWAPPVEGTLYMGDSLTNGPYTVKAAQFPSPVQGYKTLKGEIVPDTIVDPMVCLEVYKDGKFMKEIILTIQGGADIYPDYEIKIQATGFPPGNSKVWVQEYYKPWAKIEMSLRGKPKLDVTIETEKKDYTSNSASIITAKFTVKNNGNAIARNIKVDANIGNLKLRGGSYDQLHKVYYEMEKGKSIDFEAILLVPDLLDQRSYILTANTRNIDVKNLEYQSTTSSTITVSPKQNYFTVNKAISKNRIYLNDTIMVKLTVANSGKLDMNNIILNDRMNPNFELKSNTNLSWQIPVIKPGEWKDIQYSIKPLETSLTGFDIPAASIGFTVYNKQYNVSSEVPKVIVNGPKIVVNKTVDNTTINIDQDLTVHVSINNIGNIPTRIEARDFLPENARLIGGSTSLESTFLEVNTPKKFSYIMRMKKEEIIELPAAIANYTGVEYRGMTRSTIESQHPVITVVDPTMITATVVPVSNVTEVKSEVSHQKYENTTSQSDQLPITPGPGIIFGIIILILAAFFKR